MLMAIYATEGTTRKTANTVRAVSFSRRNMKILSNIENIGAAAIIGMTLTTCPRRSAVLRQRIAVLKQKPEAIKK